MNCQKLEKMRIQVPNENIDKLHLMADALIKYETIDSDQIDDIMEGKVPRPPANWDEPDDENGGTPKAENIADDAPSGEPPAKPA